MRLLSCENRGCKFALSCPDRCASSSFHSLNIAVGFQSLLVVSTSLLRYSAKEFPLLGRRLANFSSSVLKS